jgi:hypothetical protein
MNLGCRYFAICEDDSITPISRRAFDDFYLRHRSSFLQFSGSVITVATVIYSTENRRPKQIIRIECMRVRVDESGSLDQGHLETSSRLLANRIDKIIGGATADEGSGSVVNALEKFDERRWSQLHPSLSGPAHKRILEFLFGRNYAV